MKKSERPLLLSKQVLDREGVVVTYPHDQVVERSAECLHLVLVDAYLINVAIFDKMNDYVDGVKTRKRVTLLENNKLLHHPIKEPVLINHSEEHLVLLIVLSRMRVL
jgi:hypothetical protein